MREMNGKRVQRPDTCKASSSHHTTGGGRDWDYWHIILRKIINIVLPQRHCERIELFDIRYKNTVFPLFIECNYNNHESCSSEPNTLGIIMPKNYMHKLCASEIIIAIY